mmetsp:Transcript_28072/g.82218  ORF Transcript_28072/g.82218 Transcript_28072/m.82218 type:complete len:208 (+) Transcript_28072:623-1246(+)
MPKTEAFGWLSWNSASLYSTQTPNPGRPSTLRRCLLPSLVQRNSHFTPTGRLQGSALLPSSQPRPSISCSVALEILCAQEFPQPRHRKAGLRMSTSRASLCRKSWAPRRRAVVSVQGRCLSPAEPPLCQPSRPSPNYSSLQMVSRACLRKNSTFALCVVMSLHIIRASGKSTVAATVDLPTRSIAGLSETKHGGHKSGSTSAAAGFL